MNPFSQFSFGVAALLALPFSALAQGLLTPAAAPAPTMRTLEELGIQLDDVQRRIETRTVISSDTTPGEATSVYHISRPGSYMLNESFTVPAGQSGIVIACSGVSVDLNGHTIEGGTGSLAGVYILAGGGLTTLSNVRVANGVITRTSAGGVIADSAVNSMAVEDLRISEVGSRGVSFDGNGGRVERVLVEGASYGGIALRGTEGLVLDCSVTRVRGSSTEKTSAIQAGLVRNCSVRDLTGDGSGDLVGISASVVQGCHVLTVTASQGTAAGISATTITDCVVSDVTCLSSSGSIMLCGIDGKVVRSCAVSTIGTGTAVAVWGIRGEAVDDCTVNSVTGRNPYGINGASGSVRGCRVFTVAGVSGSSESHGVRAYAIQGCTAMTVSNGTSASGLRGNTVVDSVADDITALNPAGINASGVVHGCQVRNITATAGSLATWGIKADTAVVVDCTVTNISSPSSQTYGIFGATVRNCRLLYIATDSSSGTAYGIATSLAGVVEGNSLQGVRNIGIFPGQGSVVRGNAIFDVGAVTGVSNGKAIEGLTGCRIEGNTIGGTAPDYGIFVPPGTTGCLIVGNQCTGVFSGAATAASLADTGAYNVVAGNRLGQIMTGAGVISSATGALVNIAN